MSDRPRVLFAITVYNGGDLASKAVISALRQRLQAADIDIIILDDCSPEPGFSESLSAFARDRGVLYYRSCRNLGIPRNVNLALGFAARREYGAVVVSNSDVLYADNVVDELLAVAATDPAIGSVTAWSTNVGGYSLPNASPDTFLDDQDTVDWIGRTLAGKWSGVAIDVPTAVSFCVLIRVAAIEAVGKMDPVFGRGYCEENDWSIRSLEHGWRVVLAPAAFAYHQGGGTNRDAGLLVDGHTSVPLHEAIIDERYPQFRSEVADFYAAGNLQEFQRNAVEAIVHAAALRYGHRQASESKSENIAYSRDHVSWRAGNDEMVLAGYRGFAATLPCDGIPGGWAHESTATMPLEALAVGSVDNDVHRSPRAKRAGPADSQHGLRVLIDGSCLGPLEMGTQVHTVSLVAALAERSEIRSVGVSIPGSLPDYAQNALLAPKIEVYESATADFSGVEKGDVVHRPFQPDGVLPFAAWREAARRTVLTLQDVIAYERSEYHDGPQAWNSYRSELRAAVGAADAVTFISRHSRSQAELNSLPIDASRGFVVPCGTDHIDGYEPGRLPDDLARRGLVADRFLVALGADYAHKNRDLAIEVWHELIDRGHAVQLVLAGPSVPHGSSASAESSVIGRRPRMRPVELRNIGSVERNWLLRHAELVLYPTSAEGFGLVPFEASRFGTPVLSVDFGPLAEMLHDVPYRATSWDVVDLANMADALLSDPLRAESHVRATRIAASRLTWSRSAASLVSVYKWLLQRPAR